MWVCYVELYTVCVFWIFVELILSSLGNFR